MGTCRDLYNLIPARVAQSDGGCLELQQKAMRKKCCTAFTTWENTQKLHFVKGKKRKKRDPGTQEWSG